MCWNYCPVRARPYLVIIPLTSIREIYMCGQRESTQNTLDNNIAIECTISRSQLHVLEHIPATDQVETCAESLTRASSLIPLPTQQQLQSTQRMDHSSHCNTHSLHLSQLQLHSHRKVIPLTHQIVATFIRDRSRINPFTVDCSYNERYEHSYLTALSGSANLSTRAANQIQSRVRSHR